MIRLKDLIRLLRFDNIAKIAKISKIARIARIVKIVNDLMEFEQALQNSCELLRQRKELHTSS